MRLAPRVSIIASSSAPRRNRASVAFGLGRRSCSQGQLALATILPFRARNDRCAHAALIAGPPQRPRELRHAVATPDIARRPGAPRGAARRTKRWSCCSSRSLRRSVPTFCSSTAVPYSPADTGSHPLRSATDPLLPMVRGRVDGRDPGLGPARRRALARGLVGRAGRHLRRTRVPRRVRRAVLRLPPWAFGHWW